MIPGQNAQIIVRSGTTHRRSVSKRVNIAEWRGRVARGEHALGAQHAWRPSTACCPEVGEAQVLRLDEEVGWVLPPLSRPCRAPWEEKVPELCVGWDVACCEPRGVGCWVQVGDG